MPAFRDILDHSFPEKEAKIRSPLVWVLDGIMAAFLLILVLGVFLVLMYFMFDGSSFSSAVRSVFLMVALSVFYWAFNLEAFIFWHLWYRISSEYDQTQQIDLLIQFQPETYLEYGEYRRTAARSVRDHSGVIFLVAAILFFISQNAVNAHALMTFATIGYMVHAVFSVLYCFIIRRVIDNFLRKHN